MNTSISSIQGDNVKVQGRSSRVSSTVARSYPPDQFVKSHSVLNNNMQCCKVIDDVRNSNNENKMVDLLYQEYESIKPEQFESIEEYQIAKTDAYKRWKDAVELADKNADARGKTNANIFEKVWNAFCEGVAKAGDTILSFIGLASPKN